jgi:membrane protease YdiL (CAAX protease family)
MIILDKNIYLDLTLTVTFEENDLKKILNYIIVTFVISVIIVLLHSLAEKISFHYPKTDGRAIVSVTILILYSLFEVSTDKSEDISTKKKILIILTTFLLIDESVSLKNILHFWLVGIYEESLFRGLVFGFLDKYTDRVYAIWTSSVLFGLIHLINGKDLDSTVLQVTAAFFLGYALVQFYLLYNSLFLVIWIHTLINITNFTYPVSISLTFIVLFICQVFFAPEKELPEITE